MGIKAKKGEYLTYKIEETKSFQGVKYLLTITNVRKEKGRYHDVLFLKTDSKLKPEIKISVYGNIRSAPQKD